MAQSSDETAVAGAQAKFAVFLASLFQRSGIAQMSEFAELLRIFSETVADTEPAEAAVLAGWAAAIGASAGH